MKINKIPKGSELYDDSDYTAKTNKDFYIGYIPMPEDFTPNIEMGTIIKVPVYKFEGEIIYIHPNFIE